MNPLKMHALAQEVTDLVLETAKPTFLRHGMPDWETICQRALAIVARRHSLRRRQVKAVRQWLDEAMAPLIAASPEEIDAFAKIGEAMQAAKG